MQASTVRSSRRHIDGAAVTLAIHVVICCTVTAGLAFGAYQLMQPWRIENLGLAAYKPPPATVIDFVDAARPGPEAEPEFTAASIELPAATLHPAPPQQQIERQTTRAKPERAKRQRAARRKQWRDPMMGYAFHPSAGRYRAWY